MLRILLHKTVAGHTTFDDESRLIRASTIIACSYLKCSARRKPLRSKWHLPDGDFFRWIHRDLEPWSNKSISQEHLMMAKELAAVRVVIVDGRLYTEFYYDCFQTRAMFTIWGLLQLLKRYPGQILHVYLMFDCMDKPFITRSTPKAMPMPLFRYCTMPHHFDIPFLDCSLWGWSETNIEHWDKQFKDIKQGLQTSSTTIIIMKSAKTPFYVSPIKFRLSS